jgi:spore germination protein KC
MGMEAKRVTRIVLLLGMMLLITGCWNSRELKDLAIVMGMGVDKVPKTKEYRVSFQVVNPGSVVSGQSGGGGGNVTPITVFTGTGKNIFEAIRKASKKVPRQLFFSHIQFLIINEALAKEGISDLFDFFERSHEARPNSLVFVTRGDNAERFLSTLTPMEKIPANAITGKMKISSKVWAENTEVKIDDVIKSLVSQGRDPMISGIRLTGKPKEGQKKSNVEQTQLPSQIEITGISMFRDGKLIGWLEGHRARGALWINNKIKNTVADLDCQGKKGAIGVEVLRSKTKVTTEVQSARPIFHILIQEEGNITEVRCPIDTSKQEEIMKLEKEWQQETEKEVMGAVKAAQGKKSDIFGFGEIVKRTDPKKWKAMKNEWDKTFALSQVDVKVNAFIRRPGMRMKPSLLEQRKKGQSGG